MKVIWVTVRGTGDLLGPHQARLNIITHRAHLPWEKGIYKLSPLYCCQLKSSGIPELLLPFKLQNDKDDQTPIFQDQNKISHINIFLMQ